MCEWWWLEGGQVGPPLKRSAWSTGKTVCKRLWLSCLGCEGVREGRKRWHSTLASKGVSDSQLEMGRRVTCGDDIPGRTLPGSEAWRTWKALVSSRIPSTPVLLEMEFSLNVSNYEMFPPFWVWEEKIFIGQNLSVCSCRSLPRVNLIFESIEQILFVNISKSISIRGQISHSCYQTGS